MGKSIFKIRQSDLASIIFGGNRLSDSKAELTSLRLNNGSDMVPDSEQILINVESDAFPSIIGI
jgi:hypothetical protein